MESQLHFAKEKNLHLFEFQLHRALRSNSSPARFTGVSPIKFHLYILLFGSLKFPVTIGETFTIFSTISFNFSFYFRHLITLRCRPGEKCFAQRGKICISFPFLMLPAFKEFCNLNAYQSKLYCFLFGIEPAKRLLLYIIYYN